MGGTSTCLPSNSLLAATFNTALFTSAVWMETLAAVCFCAEPCVCRCMCMVCMCMRALQCGHMTSREWCGKDAARSTLIIHRFDQNMDLISTVRR